MKTDTPRTDELYKKIWLFTNEQEADDALCEMRDHARELERELDEQCRLNGKGSEREAALLGKVERLERENARLREAIADLHAIADSSYGAADHETQAAFESWMKGNRSFLPNTELAMQKLADEAQERGEYMVAYRAMRSLLLRIHSARVGMNEEAVIAALNDVDAFFREPSHN